MMTPVFLSGVYVCARGWGVPVMGGTHLEWGGGPLSTKVWGTRPHLMGGGGWCTHVYIFSILVLHSDPGSWGVFLHSTYALSNSDLVQRGQTPYGVPGIIEEITSNRACCCILTIFRTDKILVPLENVCLPFGTTGAAFYSLHESYPAPVSTLWTIFIRYHFGIWNHGYSHISLILPLITKRPLIIPSTAMPVSIANAMLLLLSSISTDTEMSLFWPNFRHWYFDFWWSQWKFR